jgi:hypothetical protein
MSSFVLLLPSRASVATGDAPSGTLATAPSSPWVAMPASIPAHSRAPFPFFSFPRSVPSSNPSRRSCSRVAVTSPSPDLVSLAGGTRRRPHESNAEVEASGGRATKQPRPSARALLRPQPERGVLLLPDHQRGGGHLYWSRAAPERQGSA